jgi:ureidoglycolate lyase
MTLIARAPDAAAFAPYGALVEPPAAPGDRRMFSDWLSPVEGLALQFHINCVSPSDLPLTLAQVERHPHAAQAFIPMDVSRYLVAVMPSRPDGQPDPARALCFVMPGTLGIVYRPGAWHAGVTVLDRPGHFAVLMWRGAVDDDVMYPLAPRLIDLALLDQTGTRP